MAFFASPVGVLEPFPGSAAAGREVVEAPHLEP